MSKTKERIINPSETKPSSSVVSCTLRRLSEVKQCLSEDELFTKKTPLIQAINNAKFIENKLIPILEPLLEQLPANRRFYLTNNLEDGKPMGSKLNSIFIVREENDEVQLMYYSGTRAIGYIKVHEELLRELYKNPKSTIPFLDPDRKTVNAFGELCQAEIIDGLWKNVLRTEVVISSYAEKKK